MDIEIWHDIVCPWCYIGKRRFEKALAHFEHRDEVEVVFRSFELDPNAPMTSDDTSVAELLGQKYGGGLERGKEMVANMTEVAAGEGLDYRLDIARRGNTFDAHRLLQLAREHDLQDAVAERLMKAYFMEAEPIGDVDTLHRLGVEAGLPSDETRAVLDGEAFAEEVRSDEATARQLGIQGVPFVVFDRKSGLSGAQPEGIVLEALRRAWA